MKYDTDLCAGGTGLGIELLVRAAHHDARLLHTSDRLFVGVADTGGIRIGRGCTGDMVAA